MNSNPTVTIEEKNNFEIKETIENWTPEYKCSFQQSLNVSKNLHNSQGDLANISFNPDTRLTVPYIVYESKREMMSIANKEDKNRISTLMLCGYSLLSYYAYILGIDKTKRNPPSQQSIMFTKHEERLKYFKNLMSCRIPNYMFELLTKIAQVRDSNNTKVCITPCLNLWNLKHDKGRLIHPNSFFTAHDVLRTERTNATRKEIIHAIIAGELWNNISINDTFSVYSMKNSAKAVRLENWLNDIFSD